MNTFKGTCAIALIAVLAGCAPVSSDPVPASGPTTKPKVVNQNESKPEVLLTRSQRRAKDAGERYLDMMGISKKGLQKQLEFEGYKKADAKKAISVMKVNWNQEAAETADNYLGIQSFSESGLEKQLLFEGFTDKQAAYGVQKAY